jgi:uncharacterized protein (TIGR03067 family)
VRLLLPASLAALSLLSLSFAPAPAPRRQRPARIDVRDLQGDWEVVSWTRDLGAKFEFIWSPDKAARIAGDRLTFDQRTWALRLDASARPAWVDLLDVDTEQARAGVCRREGDVLTICHGDPDEARPGALSSKGYWILVLKRKRP